ncbi:MAG: hypothetical protein ACXVGN_00170 [Mycobacteriaceae bacterium]
MSLLGRIYEAVRTLHRARIPLDGVVIHLHPRVLYSALADKGDWRAIDRQSSTIQGIPFEVDTSLPEDGVVLRYEVVA